MNLDSIFPTPQQLADMFLAANQYIGASSTVEQEAEGRYFITFSIERDGKRFYDGFLYIPEFADSGEFAWACKRIAEISDAAQKWADAL